MNGILDLLEKNKKTLFEYMEDNKIEYREEKKNVYSFKILFLNIKHTCKVNIYDKRIYSINLFVDKENELNICAFNELVNKYKEYFNLNYGNPISDNTNHPTDNIVITYKNDSYLIYIYGQSNNNQIEITFYNSRNDVYRKKIRIYPLLKYAIYLAGGLTWGLVMFLTMSHGDYSWENFAIWISGGLVWALAFGLIFELTMKVTPKQEKIKLKQIKKIEEKEKKLEYTINSSGQLICIKGKWSKSYTAKIYLNHNAFIILYYKNGKTHRVEGKIDLLSEHLGFGNLSFNLDNKNFYFNLYNKDEFSNIKKYIDERLGYTSTEFMEIYSLVKKIIIEYNPYSLYSTNNEMAFDYEIDIISRRIFEKKNMSLNEFKEIVLIAFDYDSSKQIYEELATILYDSIIKIGD